MALLWCERGRHVIYHNIQEVGLHSIKGYTLPAKMYTPRARYVALRSRDGRAQPSKNHPLDLPKKLSPGVEFFVKKPAVSRPRSRGHALLPRASQACRMTWYWAGFDESHYVAPIKLYLTALFRLGWGRDIL